MAFGEATPKREPRSGVVPEWVCGRTWARLPISAIFSGELSYGQLRVLVAVSTCLQEGTDWTTVSAVDLGAMIGISRQAVNKHLDMLQGLGYVRIEHRACATGFDDRRRIFVLYTPFEFENAPSEDCPEPKAKGKVVQFGDFQLPETADTIGAIEDGSYSKPEPPHEGQSDDGATVPGGQEVAPGATPIESCTHKGTSPSNEKTGTAPPAAPSARSDDAESPDGDTSGAIVGRWSRPASLRYRGTLKAWVEAHAPGLSGYKLVSDFKRYWEGRAFPADKCAFEMFKGWVRNAVTRAMPFDERDLEENGVIRTAADMIPPPDTDLGRQIDSMSERPGVVLDIVRRIARTVGAQTYGSYFARCKFDLTGKTLVIDAHNRVALERIADRFAPPIGSILADTLGKGWRCFVRHDGVQHKIAPRNHRS